MEEKNYTKIVWLILFIVLAGISCWATQQSFQLSLPSWPPLLCWALTIAVFIIASLGTKMIADSLNQNIYMENKGKRLIVGIFISIFFWLAFSMPTNTHTFFYRSAIDGIVNSDITTTKSYLDQLRNNTVTEEKILTACNKFDGEVKMKLTDLEHEIKNDANPGFGPKAKAILRSFADLLEVATVPPLSYKSKSEQARQRLIDGYRKKIYALADQKKLNIRAAMTATNSNVYKKLATTDWDNLNKLEKAIRSGEANIQNSQDINETDKRLSKAYATIKNYSQYIQFNNGDEDRYTANNQVTKVKSMLSVWSVWKDFIKGEYKGHGLIYWIMLSVLVDIAAFIFFGMTFKSDDY